MDDYQRIYGVHLLDDIHNYFPELLYNPTSFTTIPQVLSYLRAQTRQRFDLFSVGLNSYRQTRRSTTVPRPSPAMYQFFAGEVPPTGVRHRFNETIPVTLPVNIHERVMNNLNQWDSILNLVNAVLGGGGGLVPPMTNVIVRPTTQQVLSATTLSRLTQASTDICAICQDGYVVGNEKRTLNICHHSFHRPCIDTWFQENVHCPVCRHDIREGPVQAPESRD
jgi:hypothetical protein